MSEHQKKLISSFILQIGTLISPLLILYIELCLVRSRLHSFVEYTPRKCFNRFVQSAADAGVQKDKNSNSSNVAETMKLLANNSYGYQIMDRCPHTVIKHLNDEKTHAANVGKRFMKLILWTMSNMKLNSPQQRLNTKNQSTSGFSTFNTQNSGCWNSNTTEFCDVNKFEGVEMDTESLYPALAQMKSEDCTPPEM